MQLTVRDVSKFLNVSESTVTRWISQRGLPAQHVGGRYRFHRAELLEWATANQIKVAAEMFDDLEADDGPPPNLSEALEAGGIVRHLRGETRDAVLRALIEVLPLPEGLDRQFLLRLFLAREAAATTAIGDGIALPHVRNPMVLHVRRPMVTLCYLDQPVDFGALDGKPVRVLFSLICPSMRSHLQVLSRLSYALHDARFKELVLSGAESEEILREARRIEATVGEPAAQTGKGAD